MLAFVRVYALCDHMGWRSNVEGQFPTNCGYWAIDNGCTRVSLEQSGCTRPLGIVTENSVIFQTKDDEDLNHNIAICINKLTGAKLIGPEGLSESIGTKQLVHVAINSVIFGFIDDLYLMTYPYGTLKN